jgi:uncharacterized membrane protein YphA (DoxX/SURF4 family)
MSTEPGLVRQFSRSDAMIVLFRLVIGGLFIYMGIVKAMAPVTFLKLIRQYEMFPDSVWWLLNFTVATLPWIEILCGLLLILGVNLRGTALLIMVMLAVFTPMIFLRGQAIHAKDHLSFCKIYFDCGCGAGVVNFCWKMAENIALFLAALCILLSRSRRFYLRIQFVW